MMYEMVFADDRNSPAKCQSMQLSYFCARAGCKRKVRSQACMQHYRVAFTLRPMEMFHTRLAPKAALR